MAVDNEKWRWPNCTSIEITLTLLTGLLFTNVVLSCSDARYHYYQRLPQGYQPYQTASSNLYTLYSAQRYQPFRSPVQRFKDSAFLSKSSPVAQSSEPKRLVIPVGVSNYRPIQYVNSFQPFPKLAPKSTPTPSKNSSVDVATNQTTTITPNLSENDRIGAGTAYRAKNKSLFVELESRNIPLTIQFTSRASRVNIIPNDDLVGQDSNQLSTIGKQQKEKNGNRSGFTMIGHDRREQPLILKKDGKGTVPANMQSIIKCIFPDFKFDGYDKVKSVC